MLARLSAWAVAVSMLPLAGTPWEQQALARNDKTYYKQEGSDPIFVAGVRFE
ncbi:MAG: hypothetical protein KTR15_07725 [Phycisphaeraceae bacterium]|nr:hypothetical protein [Phycisphaeraceae bacterium]